MCETHVAVPCLPQAHFSAVTSLALSPDGWLLLSGARDKVVVVWDLRGWVRGWAGLWEGRQAVGGRSVWV